MKICEKCFNNTEIVEIIVNDNSKLTIVILITIILVLKYLIRLDIDKLEQIRDYLRPALELYDISINLPDTFSQKKVKIETH